MFILSKHEYLFQPIQKNKVTILVTDNNVKNYLVCMPVFCYNSDMKALTQDIRRRTEMAIEIVEKYVNELIDRSTLEEPVWNIEKIRAGILGLY